MCIMRERRRGIRKHFKLKYLNFVKKIMVILFTIHRFMCFKNINRKSRKMYKFHTISYAISLKPHKNTLPLYCERVSRNIVYGSENYCTHTGI